MRKELFPHYQLGTLKSNTTAAIFGVNETMVPVLVDVLSSEYCDPNSPQAFCTIFKNSSNCNVPPAAIVLSQNSIIDGFTISERTCTRNGDDYILFFHSVGDFAAWIKDVSAAKLSANISVFVVSSSAVLLVFNSFV